MPREDTRASGAIVALIEALDLDQQRTVVQIAAAGGNQRFVQCRTMTGERQRQPRVARRLDIALTETGEIEPPDSGGSAGMVFGREGTHVLVNGRVQPRLTIRAGAPQRWRILIAAKSRYFQLFLDGRTFTKIGGDNGLQEYSQATDRLLVATGERADVIVAPRGAPGEELPLISLLYNRGYGSIEYRD